MARDCPAAAQRCRVKGTWAFCPKLRKGARRAPVGRKSSTEDRHVKRTEAEMDLQVLLRCARALA